MNQINLMNDEVPVGTITVYLESSREAEIKLSDRLTAGDLIRIKRKSPDRQWDQALVKMRKNGQPVSIAFAGETVIIDVQYEVAPADRVYRIIQSSGTGSNDGSGYGAGPGTGRGPGYGSGPGTRPRTEPKPIPETPTGIQGGRGHGSQPSVRRGDQQPDEEFDVGDIIDLLDLPNPDKFPHRKKDSSRGSGSGG